MGLLLAFGRTTFGSLVDVIPGGADLFFRRFTMGVQLAALLLAGRGAAWLAARCLRLLESWVPRWRPGLSPVAVLVVAITAQRRAGNSEGADVNRLTAVIERDGGGRTYAGMPSNWGQDFTVGTVPVFKYLESRDVDEVGYTLRTASLMTNPEYSFDDRDPSAYRLFGIRYLILPAEDKPPVRARLAMRSGPYRLWTIDGAPVDVPAGTDRVVFRFHGYGDYPELLALGGLTLAMVGIAPVRARRERGRDANGAPPAAEGTPAER